MGMRKKSCLKKKYGKKEKEELVSRQTSRNSASDHEGEEQLVGDEEEKQRDWCERGRVSLRGPKVEQLLDRCLGRSEPERPTVDREKKGTLKN